MKTIVMIAWAAWTVLTPDAYAQRGCLGGWIFLSSCTSACTQEQGVNGAWRTEAECHNYCSCVCTTDKDKLLGLAAKGISPSDLADGAIQAQWCKARNWPQEFSYPPGLEPPPERMVQVVVGMHAPFKPGVRMMRGIYEFDASEPIIQKLREIPGDGAQLLECKYGADSTGFASYYYWYKVVPPHIQALWPQDSRGKLRLLGKKPLEQCPRTSDEANQLSQSFARSFGF